MSKEQAIYFLSEESLEALETSQGAIYLIRFPRMIEENNAKIGELEKHRAFYVKLIAEEQAGVDAYAALPIFKRVLKKYKLEKAAHIANLGNFAKDLAELDSEIGELSMQNRDMIYGYNQFVKALANVNIEAQDVVAEYHRVKDMLEKKARGEWVEEVAPVIVVAEEVAPVAVTPDEPEIAAPAEPVSVREDAIPAQNLKKNPRLSQREKFERRLALTAQKTGKPVGKQPGQE